MVASLSRGRGNSANEMELEPLYRYQIARFAHVIIFYRVRLLTVVAKIAYLVMLPDPSRGMGRGGTHGGLRVGPRPKV